jgi:CRP-like cAMP-binding protein
MQTLLAPDLARIALFKGLKEQDLREIAAHAEARAVPADTILIREGEAADALYLILRGKVKIFLHQPNGQEFVVDVRSAGHYVGEMMLDGKPRSASVKTVEPSEFIAISHEDFKELLRKYPEVALQLIRNLIRLARGHNVRTIEDVRTRDELQVYIEKLKSTSGADLPTVKRWVAAKRWVLIGLLVFAVLQYYFLDVFLTTMTMGGITNISGK